MSNARGEELGGGVSTGFCDAGTTSCLVRARRLRCTVSDGPALLTSEQFVIASAKLRTERFSPEARRP